MPSHPQQQTFDKSVGGSTRDLDLLCSLTLSPLLMTNECLLLTKSPPLLLSSSKVFFRFLTACLRQELLLPCLESCDSNDLVEAFRDFEEETGG